MKALRKSLLVGMLVSVLVGASAIPGHTAAAGETVLTRDRAQAIWSYARADGAVVWTTVHQCIRKQSDPLVGPTTVQRHVRIANHETSPDGQRSTSLIYENPRASGISGDILKSARIRAEGMGTRETVVGGEAVIAPARFSVDMKLVATGDPVTTTESWVGPTDGSGRTSTVISTTVNRNASASGHALVDGTSIVGPDSSLSATLDKLVQTRTWSR